MITTNNSSDESANPCNEQSEAEKSLQLSKRLNDAINNLRLLPEFQAISREKGDAETTMAVTKLLRDTRPELFDQNNPGDGIAFLFSGME